MRSKHLVAILVLLMLVVPATPAHAGGIVSVCDEAHLLAALAGGGTVTFACSGTITLTAEITIAANTTIDGSGQTVTISGNHLVRVFSVNSGITLNLNELTVANGKAGGGGSTSGGGIDNYGTVNVTNSTFSNNDANCQYCSGGGIANHPSRTLIVSGSIFVGNSARQGGGIANYDGMLTISNSTLSNNEAICEGCYGGGIYNHDGTVAVNNSTFTGNKVSWGTGHHSEGGGIYNNGSNGTVAVSNSTFSGNEAGDGGGIYNNGGTVTVSNSTFFANLAEREGDGIYNLGLLGNATLVVSNSTFNYDGIFNNYHATLTVSNSTFSANYSRGIYNGFDGAVTVSNSTFSGYVEGIYNYAGNSSDTFTLNNTIVANSLAGANCYGIITDGGGNLSYPDTTCPGINADPMLNPLQDNGGPTKTMALLPGSAAIDAADDAICAADPVNNLDQRGVARPQGAHCDIGAVERQVFGLWFPFARAQ